MTQPSYNQDNYRFFQDNANEASSTALGTGNNQALDMDVGTSGRVQVRIECHNTNAKAGVLPFSLEFNIDSGGWTTLDGTTDVRIYESTYNTHDEDTTQRLSSSTPYDTTNAACINSASDPVTNSNVDASVYIEVVATIYLVDGQFTGGESIQLRLVDGQTFTYSNYPTINVNQPDLVVSPSPVSTIAGRVNPTILQSSTTATPTPVSAICNKVDPTVIDSVVGLNQINWRLRDDSTALNTDGGWLAALNTAPAGGVDMGTPFRLRVEIEENNGVAETHSYKLQFRVNAGTWTDLGVHLTNNPAVMTDFSAQFLDNDATTNLLSGSSETFTAGHALENDNLTTSDTLQNEHTEFEWALFLQRRYDTMQELDDGDTIGLRVVESDGTLLDNYNDISFTVNYPTGLIGGCMCESPQRLGPIEYEGTYFYFMEHTSTSGSVGNLIIALKSTDGGATWVEVDGANNPTTADFESGDMQVVGSTVHLFSHHSTSVRYHTFNMSTETWGTTDEAVVTGISETDQAVAGVVLSNGDRWCFYRETVGGYERISYKLYTSSAWGSANNLDAQATTNWTWVTATVGENDLTHIAYQEITNGSGNMWYRNLTSGGTLSGRDQISAVSGTNNNNSKGIAEPIYWDDAGDEKILIVFRNSANTMFYRIVTNGSLGTASQIGSITVNRAEGGSNMLSAQLTGDGQGNAYLIYSDITSEDLYLATYNGSWTTGIALATGTDVTIDFQQIGYYVSPTGYVVAGYIVENDPAEGRDTGPIWYDEYILGIQISNTTPASSIASSIDPTVDISGGDETVTPAAVTGVASSVNPTVVKGSISYTPTAISAIASKADPTVSLGSTTATPSAVNTIASSVNPTVVVGDVTYTPSAVSSIASSVDPTVVLGDVTYAPTPVSSIANKVDPTVVLGSLTATPSPVGSVSSSVNPTTVLGSTTATPTPASAIGNKADPAVVLGSLSLSPSATNVITSSVAPTVILGSVTASPSAVWARATGADPYVLGGGVQVSPSAVSAVAGKSDPTVVQSSTTASPVAVSSIASSIDPAVIQGSIAITPTAGFAIVDSVDPTVVQDSITYTPAVVSSVVSSVDPFVIQSSLTLTGIVSGVGSSVNPTVLQSSTTATPTPVNTIASSTGPEVLAGDIIISPTAVYSIASSVDPFVVQSSLTLSPTAVSSIATKVDPVVIYGSISYTPTPVYSLASTVDPTIINNVTLTPTPLYAIASSLSGTIVAGEDTYYPDGDDLVGQWLNELNQSTNLWMSIDEVAPDDNDYIKSPEDPGSAIYRATFQDVLDPGTDILHKVKFRYRKNPDAGTTNMKVRLKENTTTVAEWTYTDVPATWTDGEETLSSVEADSIVNYADLLVEIEAY